MPETIRIVREVPQTPPPAITAPMNQAPLRVSTYAAPASAAPKVEPVAEKLTAVEPAATPAAAQPPGQPSGAPAAAAPGAPPPAAEQTPAEKRAARRDVWKRAADRERSAATLTAQAKVQMAEAAQVRALVAEAQRDPLALAKVLGVEPAELTRRIQNAMLSIKDEPAPVELTPEQQTAKRLEKIETERAEERKAAAQQAEVTGRQNYIATSILPAIKAGADRYEMITQQGPEDLAGFVYDLMDQHFRASSTREILKVDDVLEELELQLTKRAEESLDRVSKVKKLAARFAIPAGTAPPAKPADEVTVEPLVRPRRARATLSDTRTPPPAAPTAASLGTGKLTGKAARLAAASLAASKLLG